VRLSFKHVGIEDAGAAAPGCGRWSHQRGTHGGSIWHHADLLPMGMWFLLLWREVLQLVNHKVELGSRLRSEFLLIATCFGADDLPRLSPHR
jgi:hypothetical protein